ncbi:MAG: TatD family hydrolase [Caldilineaceae bacterium]|nr:TatD family hydrolase [Caldilineaceae bacterium]
MAWLVDSHCHLDLEQFDDDRTAVLARAADAGVRLVVVPGIEVAHFPRVLELAAAHDMVYAAVGIHPNSADFGDDAALAAALDAVRAAAQHPKVVAIGEIGLDYYWDTVPPARQQAAFAAQLELAAELGLPVIIHNRDADEDVAATLSAWVTSSAFRHSPLAQRPFAGVLHAFGGDLALAETAYSWNFVISLGGPVTFKNAKALHALAPRLQLDRLMLETDAPYLTPHPYRGKRNEPAYVALVCAQLAELTGIAPEEVAAETTAVALRFFGLEENGRAGHAFRRQISDAAER